MKRNLIFTTILLIALICVSISAFAIPSTYTIDCPEVYQGNNGWCWAAVGTSVANHFGKNITIEDFVIAVKGKLVNEGGSGKEIQDGLAYYSIDSTARYPMQMSDIVSQIYANKPIIAGMVYKKDYAVGHYYVVDGYNTTLNEVLYMEPTIGDHYWQSHSDLMDDGVFEWAFALYNIQD